MASLDLVEESDRGCVLVAAALLDERLAELFRLIFDANDASRKLQDSLFDSNGPLSTFSAKIKLAFALGLIPREVFEDLETVRRIRNDFAHSTVAVDFIGSPTAEQIEAMHCVQPFRDSMPRFSPTVPPSDNARLNEAIFRASGFVKRSKSLFTLGVQAMETELLKACDHLGRRAE